jgi:hypothetical protein
MAEKVNLFGPMPACPHCGARRGKLHEPGCEGEGCPYCGGQLLKCLVIGCAASGKSTSWPPADDDRFRWDGFRRGEKECLEFGWFAKRVFEGGSCRWVPCAKDDPDVEMCDYNRLAFEAVWSRRLKRFVLPKGGKKPPTIPLLGLASPFWTISKAEEK